ncbi:uncharacterized protein LOC123668438 [Melitaea cinxia]|uniref:uncharacterized protein LOC123668438 n=2 Tax=Melitaea cinxia TaxID=113334 RepID=UPI001E26EBA7|nr:uncharacterized protein LOC123668438 [Melitaea cinxia]
MPPPSPPCPSDRAAATTKPKPKTTKPPSEPLTLPVRAAEISDTPSFEKTVLTLADVIKKCLTPTEKQKSVSALNRDLAIKAADEICDALKIHGRINECALPTPAPSTLPTDPTSQSVLLALSRIEGKIDSLDTNLKTNTEQTTKKITDSYASITKKLVSKTTPSSATKPTTATKVVVATPPTTRPALVITTKNKNANPQETITAFKETVPFRELGYNPARVVPLKGAIRVEFDSERERDDTLNRTKTAPNSKVSAEIAHRLRPMVIIKGISKEVPSEELIDVILAQNPELGEFKNTDTNQHLTLKFKRNNRNESLYNAILITSPGAFRALIAMGRVRIDIYRVHVEEHSPFLQCRKCLQFGHTAKNCKNPSDRCAHCAEEGHLSQNCPAKDRTPKCFNCTRHKARFPNSKHETTHSSTSHTCPIVRAMRTKTENNIEYGSAPHSIALVSEPYLGSRKEVKLPYGYPLYIFQFPTNSSSVRACIISKPHVQLFGITEFSSSDLCVVRTQIGHSQLHIASIYIPPRHDHSDTLTLIEHFLQHNTHTQCILGGDLNGWNPLWGSDRRNARGVRVEELADAYGLYVCNTGSTPTFEAFTNGRTRSSIIDITLATYPIHNYITDWKVNMEACPSSQHNAIDYTLNYNPSHSYNTTRQHTNSSTFLYKSHKANWSKFKSSLSTLMTNTDILDTQVGTLDREDLELLITHITEIIHTACKESMPIRASDSKARPPWWSESLESRKREVIGLHRALHAAKRDGQPTDSLASQLHDLKNIYASELRSESTTKFREFCELQTKENVWSLTNRLLKESGPRRPPTSLKIDSRFTTDEKDTAQALLDNFYPNDTSDSHPRHHALRAASHTFPDTEPDLPFTSQEIHEILDNMSPKKAPGLDHLTSDICRQFTLHYPDLVTDIMNRCLTLQYFPKQWKEAFVKIIPKPSKTDYTDLNSYRPIGLLPVFGKVLEKLFVQRITFAAMTTDKLSERQYGFRPLTSTTAALKAAIDYITKTKSDGLLTLAISLDIKAAFDNAWWPSLLNRLRLIGCPSNIYGLVLDYTTDRTVTLDYAGARVSKPMTKGCIQGSTCGPILWNVILDELLELELPSGCRIQAFADDVLLIVAAKDPLSLQDTTNQALHAIVSWGRGVKLTFSPQKTQAIAFSDKAKNTDIRMNSHSLHFQDDIKLLGVILDNKLRFNKHVTHVINKATALFHKLTLYCKPTWGAHPENIRTIYLQVIQPIVTYAAGIWGHVVGRKYISRLLLSMQRRFALRAIKGFRTVSTNAALALAQFTPIDIKILEVNQIELARLTGNCDFLPDDITLEKHIPPHHLLHPARRITFNPHYFHSEAELSSHLSSLPNPIPTIFTDGSKLDDGSVGAAFVCYNGAGPPAVKKFILHRSCSVFQAELFAILQASRWASKHRHTHTLILSDSRAAIQASQNRSNTHPLVAHLHATLHDHSPTGCIDFAWVKAHAGITGNERADTEAKLAATMHRAFDYDLFPISFVKLMARERSLTEWRERYEKAQQGQHTRDLLPTIDHIHTLLKSTHITFTLTQTLTGHAFNKSYLHKFKLAEDEVCPCDGATPQNLDHLLRSCPEFSAFRHKHEETCGYLGVDPYNLVGLLPHRAGIRSYFRLSDSILRVLKEYNASS